jgi:outer membrane protein OmpA-like peptidoglycan-associated protein
VLETPSPSQTFFRDVEISGSADSPEGPFLALAAATLTAHAKAGMRTEFSAMEDTPVQWLRVTLRGGIDVQRDKTFFELSEIIGHGSQEPVPLSDKFTGKWKGRGVLLALSQDGPFVSGCYDRTGDLEGTVSGNMVRATGTHRSSGVESVFVLSVDDRGDIIGVSSTNGAPFRLYSGASAPNIDAGCSDHPSPTLGCGSILHGINFDYDSAVIRTDSKPLLDQLYAAFDDATETRITIVGHTSSEGSDAYNQELSRRRAEAVVAALVTRGIDASRLAAAGEGEHRPIADNATEAGRSLNRRVEIACQ